MFYSSRSCGISESFHSYFWIIFAFLKSERHVAPYWKGETFARPYDFLLKNLGRRMDYQFLQPFDLGCESQRLEKVVNKWEDEMPPPQARLASTSLNRDSSIKSWWSRSNIFNPHLVLCPVERLYLTLTKSPQARLLPRCGVSWEFESVFANNFPFKFVIRVEGSKADASKQVTQLQGQTSSLY